MIDLTLLIQLERGIKLNYQKNICVIYDIM